MNFDLTDYLAKIDFFNFELPQEEMYEWHNVHKVGKFDVLKCFSEICQLKAMKAGTFYFTGVTTKGICIVSCADR